MATSDLLCLNCLEKTLRFWCSQEDLVVCSTCSACYSVDLIEQADPKHWNRMALGKDICHEVRRNGGFPPTVAIWSWEVAHGH